MVELRRRTFLAAVASAAAASFIPQQAGAKGNGAKVSEVASSKEGTTFTLHLETAPYPLDGSSYKDDTVLAFVPKRYRLPDTGAIDWLVHFHGHRTDAHGAISHRLREQLFESNKNAVLLVPTGASHSRDGNFGKLIKRGGLARMLEEARSVLAAGPRTSQLFGAKAGGDVLVSAHSGGYLGAAAAAELGGASVREVLLFDALYDRAETFQSFVVAKPAKRKVVSVYVSDTPRAKSLELAEGLAREGVSVVKRSTRKVTREELANHRGVFLETRSSHSGADWEEGQLRMVLAASCLAACPKD